MLIFVEKKEGTGLYEPLVDCKPDMETLYIPYWDTKEVLKAQAEGEARGYTNNPEVEVKLTYIRYETYAALKEKLANLVATLTEMRDKMSMNPFATEKMPLAMFMARNKELLQNAGDSWLMSEDGGEAKLVDPDTARFIIKEWQALQKDGEYGLGADDGEDCDEDCDEDYEEDEYDDDGGYDDPAKKIIDTFIKLGVIGLE